MYSWLFYLPYWCCELCIHRDIQNSSSVRLDNSKMLSIIRPVNGLTFDIYIQYIFIENDNYGRYLFQKQILGAIDTHAYLVKNPMTSI